MLPVLGCHLCTSSSAFLHPFVFPCRYTKRKARLMRKTKLGGTQLGGRTELHYNFPSPLPTLTPPCSHTSPLPLPPLSLLPDIPLGTTVAREARLVSKASATSTMRSTTPLLPLVAAFPCFPCSCSSCWDITCERRNGLVWC